MTSEASCRTHCAHYLPFSILYGMRVFVPLGAGMWLLGVTLALAAPDYSVGGAFISGVALVAVGIQAERAHRMEFGSRT